MGPARLRDLTKAQLGEVLDALRKALARIEALLRGGSSTDFGQFEALNRREAILREVDALEGELLTRVRGMASLAAEASRAADAPVFERYGVSPVFGVDGSVVARAQAYAAAEVRDVTTQMRADLNSAIVRAVSGGSDRDALDAEIRLAFDGKVNEARVDRIVRTELGQAFVQQQAANDERMAFAGIDLIKVWVHKGGGRLVLGAREEHVAIHGQERELWQLFNVGRGATADTPPDSTVGEKANAPLDPSLSPGMRINCGCTVVRRPRRKSKKHYIPNVRPDVPEAMGASG